MKVIKRNITDACLNCVFNSKDIAWCAHHCELAQNVLADIEYRRTKNMLNSLYGSVAVREAFRSGETHAAPETFKYSDTDSITSKDTKVCMYDHAKELLEDTE